MAISRGKKGVKIFTSDREQLRENITRCGERPLAMELQPAPRKQNWIDRLLAKRFGQRAQAVSDDVHKSSNVKTETARGCSLESIVGLVFQ